MKVMLSKNAAGRLTAYVPKKDLEEEVVQQTDTDDGKVFTLANGWQLVFTNLPDPLQLPKTLEAKRLA
ncbi:NifT protein [Richelia intracellularis HM01]|uniref:putative nitrogen fixation protein NifT n=1 Tax=Richelia intracellularis TaxID=1164990 RepID=UPI0002B5053B|nr:putative nitrogen fixation protein NifT [Richelia intracellularis]CCH65474.1 NifT protein [Richelia intracellularis HM01]